MKAIQIEFCPGDQVEATETADDLSGGIHIKGTIDSVVIESTGIRYNVLYSKSEKGMAFGIVGLPAGFLKHVIK
jgi:hypothetical protein